MAQSASSTSVLIYGSKPCPSDTGYSRILLYAQGLEPGFIGDSGVPQNDFELSDWAQHNTAKVSLPSESSTPFECLCTHLPAGQQIENKILPELSDETYLICLLPKSFGGLVEQIYTMKDEGTVYMALSRASNEIDRRSPSSAALNLTDLVSLCNSGLWDVIAEYLRTKDLASISLFVGNDKKSFDDFILGVQQLAKSAERGAGNELQEEIQKSTLLKLCQLCPYWEQEGGESQDRQERSYDSGRRRAATTPYPPFPVEHEKNYSHSRRTKHFKHRSETPRTVPPDGL